MECGKDKILEQMKKWKIDAQAVTLQRHVKLNETKKLPKLECIETYLLLHLHNIFISL